MNTQLEMLIKKEIHWNSSQEKRFIYQSKDNNSNNLKIKMNSEFPDAPLYSVFENEELLFSFDVWPERWIIEGK
ncbi:hypothetical protein [Legionella cincinnatiensis]|uniref:Uncharacterized protein n=1 Tax=Legionella cincinnatiensis TaxID=28085 RepID=A0A378IG95_9GAMM|nr:hypothetical protein [Legionella cincinnatiensis]KTC92174.1 hypothetical protein Lcin_0953 [Legionella cincinnatiensis]STX33521.1 Uncharacterised protein [Legionella cincinnatiensis]